jgi:hypothetical protein
VQQKNFPEGFDLNQNPTAGLGYSLHRGGNALEPKM